MSASQLIPRCRLHGVSIFLSASIPTPERRDEYDRIPEAPLRIEEAVVCIARAIFLEAGTLVFGGHPSISPLVARVVDHYYLPAPGEDLHRNIDLDNPVLSWKNPSLLIYQSRVWENHWAEATERLSQHPLIKIKWSEAEPGESVRPEVRNQPQAPRSLQTMRKTMIEQTSPVAMIAIGGMKGVLDEAELFNELRPGKPIFPLTTTGGAAALLERQHRFRERIRVLDADAEGLVREFWTHQEPLGGLQRFGDDERGKVYVPYAFVAQRIVEQIIEDMSAS